MVAGTSRSWSLVSFLARELPLNFLHVGSDLPIAVFCFRPKVSSTVGLTKSKYVQVKA